MNIHQNKIEKYSVFTFYRYLDRPFILLLVIGIISAVFAGSLFTGGVFLITKVYAEFVNMKPKRDLRDDIEEISWVILIDTGVLWISCLIFFVCLHLVGQKVSYEFRWRYMKSILTKDSEWFEDHNLEELPTQIHTNLNEIENSSGKTIGFITYSITACISSIVYGFLLGAVYCCCFLFSPIIVMIIGRFNIYAVKQANGEDEKNFIRAGADVQQALGAIKIIKAFGQESHEIDRFIKHLNIDQDKKKWYTFLYALSIGFIETIFYYGLILAFIIGGAFTIGEVNNGNFDRNYRMGECIGISWCIQYGTHCFGNSFLNIEALQRGIDAVKSIMEVIDHMPEINVDDDTFAPINSVGNIEYKEVSFQYKSRDNPALRGIDLNIRKGKITALVGESGSGKSTAVKLLSRLYDPTEGEILVDGQDLKTINLRQYRRKISYVSQEPSLFNESIKENLLNGNPYASDAEIEQALKICMAYGFIQKLPEGINTNFGEIGGILSGGQKQRIALARAVLRKPDLLILDEATSALDTKNEKKVQEAIENVSREYKMTTVVIAHRLNTIRNADIIYVLDKGQVIEVGTHEELIRSNKTYADFYKSQQSAIEALQVVDANLEANNEYSEKNIDEDDQLGLGVNQDLKGQEVIMSPVETSIKLLNYTKPKMYVFISLICAIYVGCSFALISIPFSKEAFNVINKDTKHEKWKAVWYLCIILGSMTVAVLCVQTCARYFLRRTTDLLSINVRFETFKTLIKQPIQFFDSKLNSIESLIRMLASDIRNLNGNSVEYYLLVVQGVFALILGLIIGFCYSWRTALLLLPIAPLMSLGFTIQYQLQFTPPNKSESSNKKQLGMVSDCIMNYQTIASLAYEDEYLTKFGMKSYQDNHGAGLFNSEYINIGNAFYIAIIYGFSQAINHITYFVGSMSIAERIDSGKSDSDEFLCFQGVMMGAFVLSNAMISSPNFAKGKMVASKILSVISNPKEGTELSPIVDGTQTLSKEQASQDIEFHNVWFKYPLENSKWVLRSFNLTIKGGHTVGLVGESGSGKSTVVQLLLRFYDPQEGYISIGGTNIKEFTIISLRSMFGLIQQEPILFNTSVMENIIYGKPDANSDEIVKATTMSNSHEFICTLRENPQEIDPENKIEDDPRYSSLDEGYKASCGSKGSKLSGGQKQRIAIARALVRNPSILLLDEATSALDEKNQQKVQDALDDAAAHKTCIVIAHRTSTLKKCNKIYRIAEGAII